MRISKPINLSCEIYNILVDLTKSYTCKCCFNLRAKIILLANQNYTNKQIAEKLGVHHNTVGKWRSRFLKHIPRLLKIMETDKSELKKEIERVLSDEQRSGTPLTYDMNIRFKILMIACQDPKSYNVIRSHWSIKTLRMIVIKEKIVPNISEGAIYHMLVSSDIKPWKIRYYLHSKEEYEDPEEYAAKISAINNLYANVNELEDKGVLVYSTDEMTQIQALEHQYADKPLMPGMPTRRDYNYIRHGTTSFIGFFRVQSGKIFEEPYLNKTRTDEDFIAALTSVLDANPDKEHAVVLDNLNTHRSIKLVKFIAQRIGYTGDLGVPGKSGILQSMKTRAKFLSDKSHSIRFYYVPIHCSWMNQIEIWFGIINRQLLKRKSFISLDDLLQSIRDFIKQYNELFAHPFKWKYNSVPKIPKHNLEDLINASLTKKQYA